MIQDKISFLQEQFEKSKISFTLYDKDMQILYVNQATQVHAANTIAREMMVGESILTVIPAESHEGFLAVSEQVLSGQTVTIEKNLPRDHQNDLWFRFTFYPLYNEKEIAGVILVTDDISEQVRHRDRFLLSKEIFSHMSEGVCLLDYTGKVLWCNRIHEETSPCFDSRQLFSEPILAINNMSLPDMLEKADQNGEWIGEIRMYDTTGMTKHKRVTLRKFADQKQAGQVSLIAIMEDITDAMFYKHENSEQRIKDILTGTYNRNYLLDHIKHYLESGESFFVVNFDIDHFSSINRLKGYGFGDLLLKDFASKIQRMFPDALVVRSHSDNFFVVGTDREQLMPCKSLEYADPLFYLEVQYSISAGIVCYPEHGANAKNLIQNVEMALAEAKKRIGNSVEYYLQEKNKDQSLLDYVHMSLIAAIDAGAFHIVYQPVMDVASNKKQGYEALIRWQDQTYGMIAPDLFIPLAEKGGVIKKITEFVLRQVFDDVQKNPEYFADGYVAVNVSIIDLMGRDLVPLLQSLLTAHPQMVSKLELEVTETYYLDNFDLFVTKIEEIRKMGVKIAIDDFGTGYSSLEKLVSVDFDRLKIDRHFVSRVIDSANDQIVLETMIDLAKRLDLMMTAEGIETEEQKQRLQDIGIQSMQGYYFARPEPIPQKEQ